MPSFRICLYDMPSEIMLVIAHPSGVVYSNQAGGQVCSQPELEGVLVPVDVNPDGVARIRGLDYDAGTGLAPALADALDAILARESGAEYLRVDRARLAESMEAWVFVTVETPSDPAPQIRGPYFGAPTGFGSTHGVLTWPNSD